MCAGLLDKKLKKFMHAHDNNARSSQRWTLTIREGGHQSNVHVMKCTVYTTAPRSVSDVTSSDVDVSQYAQPTRSSKSSLEACAPVQRRSATIFARGAGRGHPKPANFLG